ncbi:PilW family protein [Agrilutibacter solisilvae]|uniref:Prepilin-type N-terminal cleavage/methylation domain-containing protein n=1 Tax=Agrilutibacter solisilvae TaxID=2763317 RepID=A0A975ARW6_9GAMM|nr:prepilin-type N-terminal cleavage/methylation domain-containing protein [Lysobacter solisilvae]QSX78304.1 prepilin-type N-terminal cleavage/methylation domain-containing protein [Lysobacter solisilvae]
MSMNRGRTFGRRARRAGVHQVHGFSLVELMVGMVLGLIVVAAVVNLVMSIIQSNNQTIRATRLTQELRATTSVIAADIKRARSVDDPFRNPMVVGGNPYRQVDTTTPGCVRYSYFNTDPGVTNYFHAVSSANGAVLLATGATAAGATCGAGTRLNSPFINISALTFDRNGRRITITVTGSLIDDPSIVRTLSQTIFIRSLAGS